MGWLQLQHALKGLASLGQVELPASRWQLLIGRREGKAVVAEAHAQANHCGALRMELKHPLEMGEGGGGGWGRWGGRIRTRGGKGERKGGGGRGGERRGGEGGMEGQTGKKGGIDGREEGREGEKEGGRETLLETEPKQGEGDEQN